MPSIILEDPGEAIQKLGEEGARRARLWLDATTRVRASWSVYDEFGVDRLKFPWPFGGKGFSYDLGGIFYGGDLDQQSFVVECKKYSNPNQGGHFDKFLAQSYVLLKTYPFMADRFLWITWHPFRITTWNDLAAKQQVEDALISEGKRVFDTVDADIVRGMIDYDIVADLAQRIWVIVLSDQQEGLVISNEDRALVTADRTRRGKQ